MAPGNRNLNEKRRIMPTELGRAMGFSRQYASKKIQEGCPTDSIESAKLWFVENASYGVGYRSKGKGSPPAELAGSGSGVPISSTRRSSGHPVTPSPGGSDWKVIGGGSQSLSSLEESLKAAIRAEEESVRLLAEAQRERNDKIIAVRLHAYNKSQVGRLAAEKLIQEIRERERILVPMDTAKAIIRKFMVPVLNRLRAFPKGAALAVNPSDDIHAESVLRVRIEALIAEVCSEFEPGKAAPSA
jgi:hypothetical protein